jgi:Tfp pilus assembly protein PilN
MRARNFSTAPRSPRSGLALTVAGALAFAAAAQQALGARADLEEAKTHVVEAGREVSALRERAKRSTTRAEADQATLAQAFSATQSPPSQVLRDMVGLMPEGVRFEALELTYGPAVLVQAQVVARRVADYDEFVDRLAASSRFGSVEPGPETREAELRASLRVVYHPEPPR